MRPRSLRSAIVLAALLLACSCEDSVDQEDDGGEDECSSHDLIFDLKFFFPSQTVTGVLSGDISLNKSDGTLSGELTIGASSSEFAGQVDQGSIQGQASYSALAGGIDCDSSTLTVVLDVGLAYESVIGWAEVYCAADADPEHLLDSYDVSGSARCLNTDYFDN